MSQPATVGTLTKFGLSGVNPVNQCFEYKSFGVGKRGSVLDGTGIIGSRDRRSERTADGTYTVGGSISMNFGPTDLDVMLYYIIGGAKDGNNNFTPTETLPSAYIAIDRGVTQFTYNGCKCNKATFSGSSKQLADLNMDWEGMTETIGAISGFSALVPGRDAPYTFMQASLDVQGTFYQFMEFQLVIDNALKLDRFTNSVSRTDLPALDRHVQITLKTPFTSDEYPSLYNLGAATPVSVVLTFTNGTNSVTFTMASVEFPVEPPETPGREEVTLPLRGVARASGNNPSIVVTNVG